MTVPGPIMRQKDFAGGKIVQERPMVLKLPLATLAAEFPLRGLVDSGGINFEELFRDQRQLLTLL